MQEQEQLQHPQSDPGIDLTRFRRTEAATNLPTQVLADELSHFVIGQPEAALHVARAIIQSKSGIADPTKPKGKFLFAGPPGVGKTEMAKAVSKVLYGKDWEKHFFRIDCGTLKSSGDITSLTGTGPKWVGHGNPTLINPAFINQKGGSVLVFDEIERAHPEIQDALLSILDEGELPVFLPTDNNQAANSANKEVAPTIVKFNNTIVIITTNAGSETMQNARLGKKGIGFIDQVTTGQDLRTIATQALERHFRANPAFLSRINKGLVVFNDLTPENYKGIFDRILEEVNNRIPGKILVSPTLKSWVIQLSKSLDKFGARGMKGAIDDEIVSPVSDQREAKILQHTTEVYVDRTDEGKLVFFEGDEVPIPQTTPEETAKKETSPRPRISVAFAYDTPFHLYIPERKSGENESEFTVSLIHDGKEVGQVEINEITLSIKAPNVVISKDESLYRMSFTLYHVLQKKPHKISITANGKEYVGDNWFMEIKKGIGKQRSTNWESPTDEDEKVDVIFRQRDLPNLQLKIASAALVED